ncbi:hypothetical protein GLI01_14490 [Gluconacetobacter liquefaciens]|nr:hypothetical protein GLI01_14490 [Gluconacetobacter liquefaciens]
MPAVKPPAMMVMPIRIVAHQTNRLVRTTATVAGMKAGAGVRIDRAVHRMAI